MSSDRDRLSSENYIESILADPIQSFAVSAVLDYLTKKGYSRALDGLKKDLKQVIVGACQWSILLLIFSIKILALQTLL